MSERPIPFRPEMVTAIMADPPRKTQTRRVVKWKMRPGQEGLNLGFSGLEAGNYNGSNPASGWVLRSRGANSCWNDRTFPVHCPYGEPGDTLYVKETFYVDLLPWANGGSIAVRPADLDDRDIYYRADGECCEQIPECCCWEFGPRRWRPSIFMPRWAARLFLRVESVRVERLQEIIYPDVIAEGLTGWLTDEQQTDSAHRHDAIADFARLWDDINGKRAPWKSNRWVWVVEFSRIEP